MKESERGIGGGGYQIMRGISLLEQGRLGMKVPPQRNKLKTDREFRAQRDRPSHKEEYRW